MRTDLNMRKGKMIAQGAHASCAFLIARHMRGTPTNLEWQWMEEGQTKITVRVDSEAELLEIHAKAMAAALTVHLITDSGKTEFNGVPTKTCLAIGPNLSEDIDRITGGLKLL
jgi:PTH2 family peptidyl-tRNA hydrolase